MDNLNIRIDTWLWVARIFKTRSTSKQAINNGKVKINGIKCKPSRIVNLNDVVLVKIGCHEKELVILQITDKRQAYKLAQLLYKETPTSITAYNEYLQAKKLSTDFTLPPPRKPDKKQRRQILNHKRQSV